MTARAASPATLLRVGVPLLVIAAAIATPADADLWGHLTFGRDIVTTGQIIQQDQYSFTTDKPWINHEWLAEVIFFGIYDVGGPPGLIAFKVSSIALLLALVWRRARSSGATGDVALVFLVIAFVGTYWRMHNVRPQLFSVALFACLLVIITEADSGRRRLLWLIPPLFASWVNLHGGYIVGLGMLGVWTMVALVDRQQTMSSRLTLAGVGTLSIAATLLNPFGIHLWAMLIETVRLERADIQDWESIFSEPFALGIPWGITLAAAILALRDSVWQVRRSYLVIIVILGVAAVRVSRLDAFFAVSVVVLLAPQLIGAMDRLLQRRAARTIARQQPASAAQTVGMKVITALAIGAMLIPAAPLLKRYSTCVMMDGAWLPEPEAAEFIQANRLRGRMLTFFDWGQYAIWHFAPDVKVSMDGRRETVYSDEMIWEHWRFYAGESTAIPFLQTLDPDYVWVPQRRPIAHQLAARGWTLAFRGPVSAIFARDASHSFQQVEPLTHGTRCFPGP